MKKKFVLVMLMACCLVMQGLFACTTFAVGKDATTDGSTMISHTCDSNSDDFRLWMIPSMPTGTERDVVLNGRAGSDYSQFPEVKDYGPNALVLDEYVPKKDTNQYLHSMYSFMNDKGLAMGESTAWYSGSTDQGKKLNLAFAKSEGIYDCYMLQDLALENCSSAREAVLFMGKLLEDYGWNGSAEVINICDGNETWILEAYGGNVWAAVRVPDNAVFVAANRCRIREFDFNDSENYICSKYLKSFALENDLWDGVSEFSPADIYCPYNGSYCTLREWRAMSLLNPSLNLDPNGDANEYPMFVVPAEKVSVDTIHKISSDYYEGTAYDCSRTVESGPFGNPLCNRNVYRTINMFRCTYIQIANVKAWLPEEARCLVWFGYGAPDSTYLTPLFASQKSIPDFYGVGERLLPYDENSGWWPCVGVQQTATINYDKAIEVIHNLRDPKMAEIYKTTAAAQNLAASMINGGMEKEAVDFLTSYANLTATDWHNTWNILKKDLDSTLMLGNVDMKVPKAGDWWTEIVNENSENLKPMN